MLSNSIVTRLSHSCLIAGLLLIAGLVIIFKTSGQPLGDFGNYYYGSKLLLDGKFDSRIYSSLHWFNEEAAAYGENGFFGNYIPVPPFSALLYSPFVWFGSNLAKVIFNGVGLVLFCLTFYRLLKTFSIGGVRVYLVSLLLLFPLYYNIVQGQAYLLVFSCLGEALLAFEKKQEHKTALLVALAASIKLFPVFYLLFFLFRKEYRIVLYTLLYCLAAVLITIPFVDFSVSWHYYSHIVPRLFNNEITGPYLSANQSFHSLFLNLFSADDLANPAPLINFPLLAPISMCLTGAFVLCYLYGLRNSSPLFLFGVTSLCSVLMNGYNATYAIALLTLFLIAMLKENLKTRQTLLVFSLVFVAFALPFVNPLRLHFLLKFTRLFCFTGAFIVILVATRSVFSARVFSLFLLAMLLVRGPGLFNQYLPYFRIQNTKGILYALVLKSTLGGSVVEEQFDLGGRARFDTALRIADNKLYYKGREVCATNDNKLSPFVLNDSLAVFMSDLNQAVRFYRLRIIKLHD